LRRGVWKSGAARFEIPELGIKGTSAMGFDHRGNGTYSTLGQFLKNVRTNTRRYFNATREVTSTVIAGDASRWCQSLDDAISGLKAFTFVLVDPLGTSWIESSRCETLEYQRSPEEDEIIGFVSAAPPSSSQALDNIGALDVGTSFINQGTVGCDYFDQLKSDRAGDEVGIDMDAETAEAFASFCAHVQGMDPRGNGASRGFFVGDRIEVLWPPDGKWYPGEVLAPPAGTLDVEGTISVVYPETRECESGVTFDRIRKAAEHE
jgi:hypothetical protein